MRGARLVLVSVLALAPFACGGGERPAQPPTRRPDSSASASAAHTVEAPRAPVPPASLAALGPAHVPPIALGKGAWLAVVGPKESVHAAWIAEEGKAPERVDGFPTAARVVGATVRDGEAYVLLESLASLDQPAGLYAVAHLDASGAFPAVGDLALDLEGVKDLATLNARLDARAARAAPEDAPSLTARLPANEDGDVRATLGTVAPLLAPAGADVLRIRQGFFLEPLGPAVGPTTLARSPHASAIVETVREAAAFCGQDACIARGRMGSPTLGAVVLDPSAGSPPPSIRAVALRAFPGPVAKPAPKASVASSPASAATKAIVDELLGADAHEVVSEAPLGASGVVAVAKMPEMTHVVFADGPMVRLESHLGELVEARYADVDGDGRTDVVLKLTSSSAPGAAPLYRLHRAPRSVDGATWDLARELAMVGAPTIDDAVKAAIAIAPRGIARAEACRVIAKASTAAGLRSVLAPTGALVTFASTPGDPIESPTRTPAAKLGKNDFALLAQPCDELYCDAASPFCQSTHVGPASAQFVFTWLGATPRLLFATGYEGS